MHNSLNTEIFKGRATKLHGDRYDYSLVEYVDSTVKVTIICREHGEFKTWPLLHINKGSNCPKCAKVSSASKNRTSVKDFIEKASKIHNNKFDYSLVKQFKTTSEKVEIICPVHGVFEQMASSHLSGRDCLKCSYEKRGKDRLLTKGGLMKKLMSVDPNLSYNIEGFTKMTSKIKYTCPVHGELEQSISKFLNKSKGCKNCNIEANVFRRSTEFFIGKAKEIHGDNYSYDKVVYKTNRHKVIITCKYHGDFLQSPNSHVDSKAGCPICAKITSNSKENYSIEESKLIDCYIYLMKFKQGSEVFYKVGISRFPKNRKKGIIYSSDRKYKPLLFYLKKTSLFYASEVEEKIFKKFKKFKYKPKELFHGHTECLKFNTPIRDVIFFIESSLLQNKKLYLQNGGDSKDS
jgi:hypothetical protein